MFEKLSSIAKRVLDKDTKTLIKAGYMDTSLQLTTVGMERIYALMLEGNKAELVKMAEEDIAEAKEEKSNS